jgi:adenylate cyclase
VSGGFQTILFTDLVSSTSLTQELGDEGSQVLLRSHNEVVRKALRGHSGVEIKHTGDGIMASFRSAVGAVAAALRMQGELQQQGIRVRIGLNAGEPIAEQNDLFGSAVQLAARITDRAEAGTVLVSNVVKELCAGKGFRFESIGPVPLKGFEEPVELYTVSSGSTDSV